MKHFETFQPSGSSFADRIGAPEEIPAAVGLIALNFADLEDGISLAIAKVLKVQPDFGQIVVAEMSFKTKVHTLGSLLHRITGSHRLNIGNVDELEVVRELISQCFRAEELRKQIMHSSWKRQPDGLRIHRNKTTAKASRGLYVFQETIDSGHLLDIADFIAMVAWDLDELFLDWE